ncbi:hypothetical protein EXIGLDRAFT_739121 [Exidia glandulosa HHB12029]|uniref:Extracellular metalloproteinase n=1 Tax=Exidia glandulosa HHB12029 TaxID=1314781 RepID=A0A165M972_EXIGL|nr:hypothetical protein EXIGLDRAFT_739121 [Exidia glandulosa HHB12029]
MKLTVLFVLTALHLAQGQQFRKSLSFGPHLTHARYEANPAPSLLAAANAASDKDPHAVAKAFLGDRYPATAGVDWKIREDSYTDANSGVTHIYARQYVNGLEVADGNLNINIKNGQVISYGDSFYRGTAPEAPAPLAHDHTHASYCAQLADQALSFQPETVSQQTVLGSSHGLHRALPDVYAHNCERLSQAASIAGPAPSNGFHLDAREAAVSFMLHATARESLADEITKDFKGHVERVTSTPVASLHGNHWAELLEGVPDTVSPVKANLAYVQTPSADGTSSELNLVWKLEVEMEDNWYEAAVSAFDSSVILSVADWVSDSPMYAQPQGPLNKDGPHVYNVFPWGVNDPTDGERAKLSPQPDAIASPFGWHSIPADNDPSVRARKAPVPSDPVWLNYSTTFGNNVFAQENWEGRSAWLNNDRPPSDSKWPHLTFDFEYDPKPSNDSLKEAYSWINNTVTQLFYTGNMIHDFFYRYGFDEVSGNFQQYNYGRGGKENDAVITNAQDGSGYNNANFATGPDGQNGRCRMYLWNTATPYRDGDLEAGIVIHEYAHGLSTRLTGGPADPSCLSFGEGGGMGEGWGDFLATMIRSNENYSDYPMGAWAANTEKGIRNYPYSLDFEINPSTYKTLDKPGYWGVHAIGEVWAEILWVIAQKFIKKHGFSQTLLPPQPLADGIVPEGDFYRTRPVDAKGNKIGPLVPKHGNTLIVQLVVSGMKLQPCRPGFFEARDAIIQADQLLTGGENFCELWEGFSERGLGPDATVIGRTPWGGGVRKDDFTLPLTCRQEEPEPEDPEEGDDDDDDDWFSRWFGNWA